MNEKINWKLEMARFFVVLLFGYIVGFWLGFAAITHINTLTSVGILVIIMAFYTGGWAEKLKVK